MRQPVMIKNTILFDAADNIWSNYFQYENDYARFLKAIGVEAVVVKSITGQNVENIIWLKKIEQVKNSPPVKMPIDPKKQMEKVNKTIK